MATRSDNSTEEVEEAKVVYALIDGRLNTEQVASSSSAADDVNDRDDDRPTPIQAHGQDGNALSSSYYYSITLPATDPPHPNADHYGGDMITLTSAEQWYEYYARRYPSRAFMERRRREWEAEGERRQAQLAKDTKKQGGGWLLRFLFGWGVASDDNTITTPDEIRSDTDDNAWEDRNASGICSMAEEDDLSQPSQGGEFTNLHANDGMCGSASLIDNSAVAREASAFHRFHLVSERRALCCAAQDNKPGWNVVLPVRQSVGGGTAECESNVPYFCIVGYGQIAEFPSLNAAAATENQINTDGANVTLTSDWKHLISIANHHTSNGDAMPHDLRHCRAASIGRDCLMVSWGRGDGWIVFYRRTSQKRRPPKRVMNEEGMMDIGWEVVAAASPSKAVIQAASKSMSPDPYHVANDVENDGEITQEHRLYDSGSLYITDLLPTVIKNNNHASHQQHVSHSPPVALPSSAMLVISRLGGFVELLPLPKWIWQSQSSPPPQQGDFLPNLTATSKTTAFSTSQHHLDVMSMDVYRTNVGPCSEWDENRHPDGPPAEIVLAVCGRSPRPGLDCGDGSSEAAAAATCLTLWGITAVHAFPQQQQQRQDGSSAAESHEPTFDLRVQRIGCIDLENVGADASLFLSNATVDHWTTSDDYGGVPSNDIISRKRKFQPPTMPCSTITTTAPLVSLRFTPNNSTRKSQVLLAALDYNGGVSMLDCTDMIRSVKHTIDQSCYSSALSGENNYPKIHLLCSRETFMAIPSNEKISQKRAGVARASQIEWWSQVADESSFTLASYATLVRSRRNAGTKSALAIVRLQQWTISSEIEGEDEGKVFMKDDPRDVFCTSISTSNIASSSVALLLSMLGQQSHAAETLSFLQITAVPNNNKLSIHRVQKFSEPDEIIAALLRRGSPSQALDVARRFGGAEHFGGRLMNECRIRLWEDQRDMEALRLVSDDRYVIHQAIWLLDQGGEENQNNTKLGGLSLEDLLEIFQEALARCDGLNESEVEFSWNAASRLRNSIRRLGTFTLLLNHFNTITGPASAKGQTPSDQLARRFLCEFHLKPLIEIASCVASQGDMNALTMLLVRHPVSMQDRLLLLDLVPLGLEIYGHLLPCCIAADSGEESQHLQQRFLPNSPCNAEFLNTLQLFTYFSDMQLQSQGGTAKSGEGRPLALDIFTDDADRDHIMNHFWDSVDDGDDDPTASTSSDSSSAKEQVATWFLKRAIDLHNETGQILSMREIMAAGLIRLGFVSFSDDGAHEISSLNDTPDCCDEHTQCSAVGKLIYLYSAASLFCHIMIDKLKPSIESLSERNRDLFTSVIQFCSMELSETVPLILESSSGSSAHNSISMFQNHVAHFVNSGRCLEPKDTANVDSTSSISLVGLISRLDDAMMELCLDKLKQLGKEKKSSSSTSLCLEESLSMCTDFVSFVIRSQCGDAEKESGLIDFAEKTFYSVLDVVNEDWDFMSEEGVIGKLWSILELMPLSATALNGSGKEERLISSQETTHQKTLESLRFKLVVAQLCCRWRGRRTIPRDLWNFLRSNSCTEEKSSVCIAGRSVIGVMCGGFCDMVAREDTGSEDDDKGRTTSQQRDFELLFDFASDVDEFDKRYYSSGVQLSGCLGKYLFAPLLSQHSFIVLKNILKIRSAWFCQDFLRAVFVSFVRDAAIDSKDNKQLVRECQEILGPTFPNLAAEFERHQHMLDAKQFIIEAMRLDPIILEQLFSSSDHSDKPIAILQALLAASPQAILLGCEFWSDESTALNASADASGYFTSHISASLNNGGGPAVEGESSHYVLPPMPGGLVMQLANILGLRNSEDLILVKRWMVYGALKISLWPAAVAICYSMLADAAFSRYGHNTPCDTTPWTRHHELQVLDCVRVVANSGDQSLSKVQLKKELCSMTLRLFSITDASLYHVLDAFKYLDYQLLALETDINISPDTKSSLSGTDGGAMQHSDSDLMVFKSAGLVARQARDFLDHSSTISRNPSVVISNNFYDRNMTQVFNDMKQSSLVDVLQLLFSTRGKFSPLDKSSLDAIGEAIFNWVVSETFKARKTSHSTAVPAANILMMMEFGSSFVIERLGRDQASLIINQTWEAFKAKTEMFASSQENITSPDYSIQPDISIVKRLNDRGYGWNAARRAVIMTNNQGYSPALTWAVSHFQDTDFDCPIYFLHADSSACVDRHLIAKTSGLLRSFQVNMKDRSCTGKTIDDLTKSALYQPSQERNGIATALSEAVVSPLSIKSNIISIPTKKHLISKIAGPVMGAPLVSLNVGDRHSVHSTPKNGQRTERMRPPNSTDSISSVEGSLSSRASVKKQIKRGTHLGTQKLSLDERKKLALQGKRLLDAARTKQKRVTAPPTTIGVPLIKE